MYYNIYNELYNLYELWQYDLDSIHTLVKSFTNLDVLLEYCLNNHISLTKLDL